jgi:adenylate cyclase
MALEIERKFTIHLNKLDMAEFSGTQRLIQGILHEKPWVRVRLVTKSPGDAAAYLTIKFKTENSAVRRKYEYPIPQEEAREMLKDCKQIVTKLRHTLVVPAYKLVGARRSNTAKTWIIDQFLGEQFGLWLAEFEMQHVDEEVSLPEWVDKDVTGDPEYSYAAISARRYQAC